MPRPKPLKLSEAPLAEFATAEPGDDLGAAGDDTDIRFQGPSEIMLAAAEQRLAADPTLTTAALLHGFARDIRNLNGDPCKEQFNPEVELMKIGAQHQLIQKLTHLATMSALPLAGGRRRRTRRRHCTRRKSKRGKKGGKSRGSRRCRR